MNGAKETWFARSMVESDWRNSWSINRRSDNVTPSLSPNCQKRVQIRKSTSINFNFGPSTNIIYNFGPSTSGQVPAVRPNNYLTKGKSVRKKNTKVHHIKVIRKNALAAAGRKPTGGRKAQSLSSATVKIIWGTRGLLPPDKLLTFLKLVRAKRYATEIAQKFTTNIHGLVDQLQKVMDNYYQSSRKGKRMKHDIDFIRRLITRLQRGRNEVCAAQGFSRDILTTQTEYSREEVMEEYSEEEYSEEDYSEEEV